MVLGSGAGKAALNCRWHGRSNCFFLEHQDEITQNVEQHLEQTSNPIENDVKTESKTNN